MPDGLTILVLLVIVGLSVVLVRSLTRAPGPVARPPEAPAARPPEGPVAQPPVPATSLAPDPGTGEDFYRDEDEFAVFADEGDEGDE